MVNIWEFVSIFLIGFVVSKVVEVNLPQPVPGILILLIVFNTITYFVFRFDREKDFSTRKKTNDTRNLT